MENRERSGGQRKEKAKMRMREYEVKPELKKLKEERENKIKSSEENSKVGKQNKKTVNQMYLCCEE